MSPFQIKHSILPCNCDGTKGEHRQEKIDEQQGKWLVKNERGDKFTALLIAHLVDILIRWRWFCTIQEVALYCRY